MKMDLCFNQNQCAFTHQGVALLRVPGPNSIKASGRSTDGACFFRKRAWPPAGSL